MDKKPEDTDPIYVAYGELYLALNELMGEKEKEGRSERARYLAIVMTDLEKIMAFMKVNLLEG